jgi:hypothetical protein
LPFGFLANVLRGELPLAEVDGEAPRVKRSFAGELPRAGVEGTLDEKRNGSGFSAVKKVKKYLPEKSSGKRTRCALVYERNETFCFEWGDGQATALFEEIRHGPEILLGRGRVGEQAWFRCRLHWRRSKIMGHLKRDLYNENEPKQQAKRTWRPRAERDSGGLSSSLTAEKLGSSSS